MHPTNGKMSNMGETRVMIRINTSARCGILGNPSDGFFGKTIAVPARNFHAQIILFECNRIEILPGPSDHVAFNSLDDLIADLKINGYYGGFRLIKAAIKQFHDYVKLNGINLEDKQFTIRYTSNIPRQVGLAGSSAIITSTIKALANFYGITIEKPVMANYVLWSETKELGISAGLQDRVVQVYDEPIFMDFDEDYMKEHGYGKYGTMDPNAFPPMYLAYKINLTHKATAHNDVRKQWLNGDEKVRRVMQEIAANAQKGYDALLKDDQEGFKACIDKNFDLRASIYSIAVENLEMIKLARSIGATAKFPGSGGAIIGTFSDDQMLETLKREFSKLNCDVVRLTLI
ncbi:GHMP kinase [Candidatus Bathyarchaeota archaeon]|nr:GHMP kinase [Candidatus Bathyarchaeota archaeon]